jgi:hypothetical protein
MHLVDISTLRNLYPFLPHHIKKLADLKRRYQGQTDPPLWVKRMIARQRKTLVVCIKCHRAIHAGTYDGPKVN